MINLHSKDVKLVWITPECEKQLIYMARVSSDNQANPEIKGLMQSLQKRQHWSPYDMCDACIEITTSRDISAQMLRHWSFRFQEFSQRYAEVTTIEPTVPRLKGKTDRQSSIALSDTDEHDSLRDWFTQGMAHVQDVCMDFYKQALEKGFSRDSSRRALPISATTRLYMKGSIRSWITYLMSRADGHAQYEHQQIAYPIMRILAEEMPIIASAFEWDKKLADITLQQALIRESL